MLQVSSGVKGALGVKWFSKAAFTSVFTLIQCTIIGTITRGILFLLRVVCVCVAVIVNISTRVCSQDGGGLYLAHSGDRTNFPGSSMHRPRGGEVVLAKSQHRTTTVPPCMERRYTLRVPTVSKFGSCRRLVMRRIVCYLSLCFIHLPRMFVYIYIYIFHIAPF